MSAFTEKRHGIRRNVFIAIPARMRSWYFAENRPSQCGRWEDLGTIKESDLKVRKKNPPPTQVQKSPRDYDRKKLKQEITKELDDE